MDLEGHVEAHVLQHGVHQLARLLHVGEGIVGDDQELGVAVLGLLAQRLGLVGIECRPRLDVLAVPRARLAVEALGDLALLVEHRLVDALVVDGVRRRQAQHVGVGIVLGRERPVLEVEGDEGRADLGHREGVVGLAVVLDEGGRIGIGDVVDQVELAGAQRRQPHAVLLLGPADQAVEIGQRVALGIGLPEVLEAHQLADVEALPRLELERPAAHRLGVGLVDGAGRDEVDRVVDQVGIEGRTRLLEMDIAR